MTKRLKVQTGLIQAFRHIKPTWKYYLEYVARAAAEGDGEMRKFLHIYETLPRREQMTATPEQICEYSGIAPKDLFGAVAAQLYAQGSQETEIIRAVYMPQVMKRTMQQATTKGGVKDREMVHKASGFLPTPNGPTFINNPQTLITGKAAVLPSMEQQMTEIEYATVPLLQPGPAHVSPEDHSG